MNVSSVATNQTTESDIKKIEEIKKSLQNRTVKLKSWIAGIPKDCVSKYLNGFEFHPDAGREVKQEALKKRQISSANGWKGLHEAVFSDDDFDMSQDLYMHTVSY